MRKRKEIGTGFSLFVVAAIYLLIVTKKEETTEADEVVGARIASLT